MKVRFDTRNVPNNIFPHLYVVYELDYVPVVGNKVRLYNGDGMNPFLRTVREVIYTPHWEDGYDVEVALD